MCVMKMKKIEGIIPAMLTPLNSDETINFNRMQELMTELQNRGVHGIFVGGTQGEFFAFTAEERKKMIDTAVENIKANKTLFVGTGAITTRESIELTKYAQDAGADFAVVITPYFVKLSQTELIRHYSRIAESTDINIVLYNNPSSTGNNLLPESVKHLSDEFSNIVGIKESSVVFEQLSKLIRLTRSKNFSVIVGLEPHILGGLLIGAKGAVAASGNVIPELLVELYNAFKSGDIRRAAELQNKVNKFFDLLHLSAFPGTVKDILRLLGKDYGLARSPVMEVSKENIKTIKQVLRELSLL